MSGVDVAGRKTVCLPVPVSSLLSGIILSRRAILTTAGVVLVG